MNEQPGAQKGANLPRKRNALGRGLSALMSAAAVSVDFAQREGAEDREHAPTPAGPALEVLEGRGGAVPPKAPAEIPTTSPSATAPASPSAEGSTALEGGLIYLSIDRVFANKGQPRKHFAQADIDSLAESIHRTGLLQPIVVRRRSGERGQLATYEIIAGERRWRAAKQAGLVKIPALLRSITDREALELGIVENVQRADLNAMEEATAYQRLCDEFGATQAEVAETVGRDRASVANALRLLKLSAPIQEMIVRGELSAGHGRAVLVVDGPEAQLALAKQIVADGLSVRAAERLAAAVKAGEQNLVAAPAPKSSAKKDPNAVALEERFRRALGTKVRLELSKDGAGELRISFFSAAELETLLEKVGA